MKRKFWIAILITVVISLAITGCAGNGASSGADSGGAFPGDRTNESISAGEPTEVVVPDGDDVFTDADRNTEYDEASAAEILLSGNSAACSSPAVAIADGMVTITAGGTFIVGGTGENVTIAVDADGEKVRLVLRDVTIANDDYPAVYVKSADKVFLISEGTNTLSVTGSFVQKDDNKTDGTIFAKDDIVLTGSGSLTIKSPKHGIVGKDDVKITGGTLSVNAGSHGIQANDSVDITNAAIDITSGKDGIHVENEDDETKGYFYLESGTLSVTAGYDGVDASGTLQITDGTITIASGGGSGKTLSDDVSAKGLKADGDTAISGGTIVIDSCDDAIHSNGSIRIDGGKLTLSSGDDGIHADTSLLISGGEIDVTKSYEGLEGQNVTITGGDVSLIASDDGINAAGGNDGSSVGGRPGQNNFNSNADVFISISGGSVYVNASGDGIDSNGNLLVSGGTIVVEGPTNDGNGALDYDNAASITGGTLIAIGSSGMAMNFSSAMQGSILLSVGNRKAGTTVAIADDGGNVLASMTATKTYASVVISCPSLTTGNTYTLTAGTFSQTISLSSLIYGGNQGGNQGGNPGGNQGGNPGGNPGGGFRP